MKIKMLTSMSGPTVQRRPGDEIEVSAGEARRLIESGFAEPVRSEPREKAVSREPHEKAVPTSAPDSDETPPGQGEEQA